MAFACSPSRAPIPDDSAADSVAPSPSSTGAWLPSSPGELDERDRLEESDPARGLGARADLRARTWSLRHVWWEGGAGPLGETRIAWLNGRGHRGGTVRVRPFAPLTLIGGAVVVRHPPSLLGEALGLARPVRTPRGPIASGPELEGPRGASSTAFYGGAIRAALGHATAWGLAGSDAEGSEIHAGGVAVRARASTIAAAAGGLRGGRRAASLSFERTRAPGDSFTVEVLLSPERGPELLAEETRGAGPFRVVARWRRRPSESRPVAGELAVGWISGPLRTRLSWRPWSARAEGDDGRVELDTSLRSFAGGPIRIRLGSRGGTGAAPLAQGRGERYGIVDLGLARERGRSVSLIASARESRRAGGTTRADAIGGRLQLSWRGRAGATLVMQARRATPDRSAEGTAAGSASAWTAALASSGDEVLTSRSGSGLSSSGRAWLRLGGIRVEAFLSNVTAAEDAGSSSGSLRIEWDRAR